jgi:hypothetical protein
MGKNSLIKSTSKKKKNQKQLEDANQIEKSTDSAGKAKPEPASKLSAKAAPKKETLAAETVTPTYRDLIFKKFTDRPGYGPVPGSGQEAKKGGYEAPPFYPAEIQEQIRRFKTLLFKKFDLTPSMEADAETLPEDTPVDIPAQDVETITVAPVAITPRPVAPTPPLKPKTSEQNVAVLYAPDKAAKPADPADRMMKLAVGVFAFFVLILLAASFSNHGTYHLIVQNGKTEIWQGRFGPMGKTLLTTLPDAGMGADSRSGSKKEIFPIIVDYYLNRADAGLEVETTPDFKEIRSLLAAAEPFAATPSLEKKILERSNVIDLMTYLYKAQVAAGLETKEGFAEALAYLEKAKSIGADQIQSELVLRKIEAVRKRLADMGLPIAKSESR